jgi:exonuclease VII small subunit
MPTKPDSEIIQASYEATVSKVFAAFVDNLASGVDQEDSESKFSKGIQLARTARDRALKLI